jgi:RIO-like serine/threonine protein kinase
MVRYNTVPYEGYALIFGGYDTLALRSLVKKGTIQALGPMIGEGKESVVYDASVSDPWPEIPPGRTACVPHSPAEP